MARGAVLFGFLALTGIFLYSDVCGFSVRFVHFGEYKRQHNLWKVWPKRAMFLITQDCFFTTPTGDASECALSGLIRASQVVLR